MRGKVYVIGAGLSGLSAAVRLLRANRAVEVYEAAGQAGGRCRSFFDETLGRQIDNGNHLVLSGNRDVYRYIEAIGAADGLDGPERSEFHFLDLESDERWLVRPGAGRIPWWIFSGSRRVPGSRPQEYLQALRLAWAGRGSTVAQCFRKKGVLFKRFWEPLTVAALNASADEAAAYLLWPVIRQTFGRGEAACRPRIARTSLSDTFVDPALRLLAKNSVPVHFRKRLHGLTIEHGRVTALRFAAGQSVEIGKAESVVLAVPPSAASKVLPALRVPRGSRAIVNGHFLLPAATERPQIVGMIGGLCHWLFVRDDIASVTVSAADDLAEQPSEAIAERMWEEVCQALKLQETPLPVYRIVKEKRATFLQSPSEVGRRPEVRTDCANLFLAGDWTDTGLPATIEGSLRSGRIAAETVLASATTP